MTDDDEQDPEQLPTALTGIDLVRRTLEEARAAARAQGKDAGRGRAAPRVPRRVAGQRRSWSGPGPDVRDPQPLGRVTRDLAKKRGWSSRVAEGTVLGHWPSVVGQQIAEHATPTALNDGRAQRDGRIDGLGHPAADDAGATAWPRSPRRSATVW